MPLYESVLIARQDVSATQVDDLVANFQNVITENGGSVGKTENWGLRTMAYKINKNRKGHYILMNIDAPSDAVLEMERQMRINEDILRYLTLRVDEHETEPSAVVRNKGSEDRSDAAPAVATAPAAAAVAAEEPVVEATAAKGDDA